MIELIDATSRVMVDVKVVPGLAPGDRALRARLEDLDGVPVINVNDVPMQGVNAAIKRLIDMAISSVALVALSIPLGNCALLVKLTSKGSVFYRQERMGLDGKSFSIVKFRSMYDDAEKDCGPVWARARRSTGDRVRPVPAAVEHRRTAAALERVPRRYVDCGPAAGASALRRAVQAPLPAACCGTR